jgi:hypothetical protein
VLTTFRFGTREKHVREALTAAFSKRGVDLANLDPSIQSTMVAAALSTGAEEQVERFARVATIAAQFDLAGDLKREMVVNAYAAYAKTLEDLPASTKRGRDEERTPAVGSGTELASKQPRRAVQVVSDKLLSLVSSWRAKLLAMRTVERTGAGYNRNHAH